MLINFKKLFINHYKISIKLKYLYNQQYKNKKQIKQDKKIIQIQQQKQLNHEKLQSDKQINQLEKSNIYWNQFISNQSGYNFQKEIILSRKQYQSSQQLKSAILFQEILQNSINITLYDTRSKAYRLIVLKFILICFGIFGSVWILKVGLKRDPKMKVIMQRSTSGKIISFIIRLCCFITISIMSIRYLNFISRHVEKVSYCTENQKFTFVMRTLYGTRYSSDISRYKLVYTQNPLLNKLGTNYFHLATKKQYNLSYRYAWIKQDLFSHLISQRIKI